ncbi:unnamed protein product [Cylindrotheca closterium]|uniref:Uncharacterized protein n=1 Tax=Cylindrotheca closterium TaxID=2856 RepID=A0AAD2GAD8_9STRA|nr:unnamed protein product [Cylindrotheca closterium]
MTNTIINYINYITTIIVNQEYIIQAGISFFRLPVRMPLIVTQTVRETIAAGLVCATALLLVWYMALDLYRSYQALCEQRSCNRQQPPVSILRRPGGSSHRKKNRSWFGVFTRKPNRVRFAKIFRRTFVPNEQELQSRRECWGLIQWRIQLHDEVIPEIENTVRFVPHTPVSILRPSRKDWGSPKPTSSNRVQFAPKTRRRNFIPDEEELKSRRQLIHQIECKVKRRNAQRWKIDFKPTVLATIIEDPAEEDLSDIDSSLDTGFIDGNVDSETIAIALENHRQLLRTVIDDMLSNIPVPMDLDDDGNVEPNDMQGEAPRLSLKRTATCSLVSSRPTKRRKLNSSTVPTSATEWAKRINERFTPLLPVIIEDPEEEDIIMSTFDLSLDAGLIDDNSDSDVASFAKGDDEVFFPMNDEEQDWDSLEYVDCNSLEHAPPTSTPTTAPVSILRPARKDWKSPRTTNRVSFTLTNQRRNFMPDPEDIQSRKNRIRDIYSQIRYHGLCKCFEERVLPQLQSTVMAKRKAKRKAKKKAKKKVNRKIDFKPTLPVITEDPEEEDKNHFDSSVDAGLIDEGIDSEGPSFALALENHHQMLRTTVLPDMLSNIPVPMDLDDDDNVEPNDMQDEAPQLSLKRTATYCLVASRPTKRRKLNSSSVPTSATEWAKQINERFTPLLPVIFEDPEEEEEQDNFSDIESSLDAGLIDDGIDSTEDPLEDTIIDDDIPAPPPEDSDIAATIDIPPDGMGSGWTESGKRYSLRRAKLLIPHAEDTFTEALGSGMTEQGRRYSRRVANRRNGAN